VLLFVLLGGLAGIAGDALATAVGHNVLALGEAVFALAEGEKVHRVGDVRGHRIDGGAAVVADQSAGLAVFGAGHGVGSPVQDKISVRGA